MIKKHCVSKKHLIYKPQLLNPSAAAKLFNQLSSLNRSCKYQAYSKWVPLPYATWYFAHCCPIFPKSYQLFLTDALWRNTYLTYWVRSGQKATPTASPLDFLLSFFVSSLVSLLYAVVTKVKSWRSHVTWRSLFGQASKYENTNFPLAITSE